MFTIRKYVLASDLSEAYELKKKNRNNVILGGNLWLKMGDRNIQNGIDLSGLGLDQLEEEGDSFCIGCMCSLRELETNEALNHYFNGAIKEALRHIVGVQFRNCATVGGSLFPRFGFSDVLTIMLALDSYVELYDRGVIPMKEFSQLPVDNDILSTVFIKKDDRKVSYQCHRITETDFAVLTCAVAEKDGKYSVVLGARPAKAVLIDDVELLDPWDEEQVEAFAETVTGKTEFDSNMRGSREYRQALSKILIRRGIEEIRERNR
ncbi:MAG: FAD binding domain-containing protein [Lachnospiraceae bacterium]|nr:FAD binding domain-containing protein [Lachnospiraceae bacterium]